MTNNIFFDLDGTLIDSMEEVKIALRKAYLDLGLTPIIFENMIQDFRLDRIINNITPNLTPKLIPKMKTAYRLYYDHSDLSHTKLFDRVWDCLNQFQISNNLYLLTNKPTFATTQILDHFNLHQFKTVICSDTYPECTTKQQTMVKFINEVKIPWDTVMYIGDTLEDFQLAEALGITFTYSPKGLLFKQF